MDRVTRIGEHFAAHAALVQASADALGPALARAADVLTECVLADGRILSRAATAGPPPMPPRSPPNSSAASSVTAPNCPRSRSHPIPRC